MNRIEWEKTTVQHMIELWCRKKHGKKELCVECRELMQRSGSADASSVKERPNAINALSIATVQT